MEPRQYQSLTLDSLPNREGIPSCSVKVFDEISTEQQEKKFLIILLLADIIRFIADLVNRVEELIEAAAVRKRYI